MDQGPNDSLIAQEMQAQLFQDGESVIEGGGLESNKQSTTEEVAQIDTGTKKQAAYKEITESQVTGKVDIMSIELPSKRELQQNYTMRLEEFA